MTLVSFGRPILCLLAVAVVVTAPRTDAQQAAPPLQSGFNLTEFDRSSRPQDDLYRYVNSRWLAATAMPDDRVTFNAATELTEKTNVDIRAIIESLAASGDRRPGSPEQQVIDLYNSMMDVHAIEARGISPLLPELKAIDAIDSVRALAERAGRLSATTTSGPFPGTVGLDPQRPGDRLVQISQGGILLDRERYLNGDDVSETARTEYRRYLERIFSLVGRADPARDAAAVVALETELAAAQIPRGTDAPDRPTQPLSLAQMNSVFPGFDWVAWGRPQGIDRVAGVVVQQPSFFKAFAALVPVRPMSTWRAWLAGRYLTALSPYANQALSDARFDFFGRFLTGQQAPIERWKRGVSLVNRVLGDVVGRLYATRHFPRASRQRVERIVDQIVRAYRQIISEADWLSGSAKTEAQAKLQLLKTRVGYPDIWKDYRGLEIRPDDLFGNLARAQAFDNIRRMTRIAGPEERGEWITTGPQVVNAYYVPAQNEIVLPAAILQPPYFNASAEDAVNYGAIGAVIGHEIMHGLDGTGRYYDAKGGSTDWWKTTDEQGYLSRAQMLFDDLQRHATAGVRINPALVVAESLADLVGLSVAHKGYQLSLAGRSSPVIDGLTGDQRFFLGWARIWRTKERPEFQRQIVLTSRHAPAAFRANGTPGHVEAFYRAFDVSDGDKLFIALPRRARIY